MQIILQRKAQSEIPQLGAKVKDNKMLSGMGSIIPDSVVNKGIWSSLVVGLGALGLRQRRLLLARLGVIGPHDAEFLADLESVWSHRAMPDEISRVGPLSQDEFHVRFARCGVPVVLTGVARDWPVMSWTSSFLRERYGSVLLRVRKGGDYDKMAYASMTITEYLQGVERGEDFYMANNPVPSPMRADIAFPPYLDSARYYFEGTRLWIGGDNSGAHLHRDLTDNFLLTVLGRKKILLASPSQTAALYTWEVHSELTSCKFSALAPDYVRFPKARKARWLTVELVPGDLLYIPCGWYHQVSNQGLVCSVNFFLRSSCAELPRWHDRKGT